MEITCFIANYGLLIMTVICSIVSVIIAIVKAAKNGNTKGLLSIIQYIPELVTKAEELFGSGNGKAKFTYVSTELKLLALQYGLKFDEELMTSQIEKVVNATKYVNATPTPDKVDIIDEDRIDRNIDEDVSNDIKDNINI